MRLVLCAAIVSAVMLSSLPASAVLIGKALLVNANTTALRPGGAPEPLIRGVDIVKNQRIETDAIGQAQIMFADRTSLTIGPNTSMALDKYKYDPAKKRGQMSVSLTKGLMRFVGGRITKTYAAQIRTPSATMGIRGGMALVRVDSKQQTKVTFLYGDSLTISVGGKVAGVLSRPGFSTLISDAGISPPRWESAEDIEREMEALQGRRDDDDGRDHAEGTMMVTMMTDRLNGMRA